MNKIMLFTPLEQFKVLVIFPLEIFGLDLSLTNSSLLQKTELHKRPKL